MFQNVLQKNLRLWFPVLLSSCIWTRPGLTEVEPMFEPPWFTAAPSQFLGASYLHPGADVDAPVLTL